VGGILVIYAFGVPVQSFITRLPLEATALQSLVFLPGDLAKAFIAAAITATLARAYPRAFRRPPAAPTTTPASDPSAGSSAASGAVAPERTSGPAH
jgi:biotin transport system substrate-specific component